jgi:hypothetical protein
MNNAPMRVSSRRPTTFSAVAINPFVAPMLGTRTGKLCFACKVEVVAHPADVLCVGCLNDWKDIG